MTDNYIIIMVSAFHGQFQSNDYKIKIVNNLEFMYHILWLYLYVYTYIVISSTSFVYI